MLVSDIITTVRALISDPQGQRWDDAILISLIDECQKFICRKVDVLYNKEYITVSAGIYDVALAYSVGTVYKVLDTVNKRSLTFTTEEDLDAKGYWEDTTGTPTHIVFNNQSKRNFTLYPTPALDTNILVKYSVIPDTLTSVTDSVILPEEYSPLFKYYVTAQLFMFDMDSMNRQFGNEQFQLFNAELINIKNDYAINNTNIDRQTKQRKF